MSNLREQKEQLDEDLKAIERQIYDLEESYIEETGHYGNIIKGWDGYLTAKPKSLTNYSRKGKVSEKNRIFTQSSSTAKWLLNDYANMQQKEEDDDDDDELEAVPEEPVGRTRRRAAAATTSYNDSDDDF